VDHYPPARFDLFVAVSYAKLNAVRADKVAAAQRACGRDADGVRAAAEARRIILDILRQEAASDVIKIKTMTSAEIQLNPFLQAAGVNVFETDLAEIILQLGEEEPSHIVVPALHINRSQVREIFARRMGLKNLSDDPKELTNAARTYLRQKFLSIPTAISGANFLIAETGSVAVVESEGNGRMCLTLPRTMITLAGIEKVLPRFQDLEVMLQLLARSATGERMNPYTSLWTGVTAGDGPQSFHVVLLDNGRSSILAKPKQRQTLKCIRCAACMNACPVYRQTGGHPYGSVYPGPIGAILTPQLMQMNHAQSLPYASSLCGACYEVCPVKINIPEVLLELRAQVVNQERRDLGRFFDPAQESPGAAPAVVVSERFWRMRLRADPHVIGRALRVNGQQAAIVGVGPKDFLGIFPSTAAEIFLPVTADPAVAPELADDILHRTTQPAFRVLVRLRPGMTMAATEARLDAHTREMDRQTAKRESDRKGRQVHLVLAGRVSPYYRTAH